jgi:transcriptional regulator with XRE-family HTH domain
MRPASLLRDQREARRLSLHELSAVLGVHPTSILRWERRERFPGPAHVRGLADVLGLSVGTVSGFFDEARASRPHRQLGLRGYGIRCLRLSRGMSAASLARALDMDEDGLERWLRSAPRPEPVRPSSSPLRQLRHRSGMSQEQVAAAIGTSRRSLGKWEGGATVPLRAVRELARLYGVPASQARLGALCEVSTASVRSWESGRTIPRAHSRGRLEQLYGLPPGALLQACPRSPGLARPQRGGGPAPGVRDRRAPPGRPGSGPHPSPDVERPNRGRTSPIKAKQHTLLVPQARVELATFRLGGGCTSRPDLRRRGSPAAIDIAFPYGSPLPGSPSESRSVPERTHRHGSAPLAHLHHVTAPTDLQAGLLAGLPILLTIHDIASLLRLHRTAAYARTREPDFPDPLVISGSCYRWYTHEVLAYVDARRAPKIVPRPRRCEENGSLPSVVAQAAPRVRVSRRQPHDADPDVPPPGDRRGD